MHRKRGIALIIALLVIMVLAILTTALLSRSVTESRNTWRFVYAANAFWLAEAGIQRGLYQINNAGGSWTGWTDVNGAKQLQVTLAGRGDYNVTVSDPASTSPLVTATGFFPGRASADAVSRAVRAHLRRSGTIFKYAAFGGTSIRMSGQATTDSYDSSLGAYNVATNRDTNGDVGTNGDITATGSAHIYGDAGTGDTGTFSDTSKVSGSIEHENDVNLPLTSVPASLGGLSSGGTINSTTTITAGDHKYLSISLSSKDTVTIVGPANIYLTGATAIKVSGQAQVVISSSSAGPVNIYFDGDIDLTGQGVVNNTKLPSQFILYGTNAASQDVKMAGQDDFYGAIYAPTAVMNLSGQGALFGSFIGDTVDISGQGGVHYDEQLANASAGATGFSIDAWQDTQDMFPVSP